MMEALERPGRWLHRGLVRTPPFPLPLPTPIKSSEDQSLTRLTTRGLGKMGMADRMSHGRGLQEASKVVGLKTCAYTQGPNDRPGGVPGVGGTSFGGGWSGLMTSTPLVTLESRLEHARGVF